MSVLESRRVVATRPVDQAGELCELLRARGAIPIPIPTVAIEPPADASFLNQAIRSLEQYDWIVLTSPNGARAVLQSAKSLGRDLRSVEGPRWAAVGPATNRVLEEAGLAVSCSPSKHRSEGIPSVLGELSQARVLLPRSDLADEVLPNALLAEGARVDAVPAYRTVLLELDPSARNALEQGVDAITFTSPSTVRGLVDGLDEGGPETLESAVIATIGPVTSKAARALGLRVDVEANQPTPQGIVAALESFSGWAGQPTRTAS